MSTRKSLPQPAELLPDVISAVRAAGALIRAEFHRPNGPRGAGSTAEVDADVETLLRDRLMPLHRCSWHGEELDRIQLEHSDCWVVDPQDGTSAFLQGYRGSSISVGLLRHGVPVLGVVFAPVAPDDAGDLFSWSEGGQPLRNGQPLPRLDLLTQRPYDHATIIGMNERAGDYALHNHTAFAPAAVRAIPSIAYRLALAAAGELDAAISLTPGLDSYDIAGGHALLIGVGGVLLERDGGPVVHRTGCGFSGCIGGRVDVVREVLRRKPTAGKAVPRHAVRPARRDVPHGVLDRAQGALLGLLVGDALGAQVEFKSRAAIRAAHPEGLREMRPGGTWNLLAGQPTDDGEMALALARSIVARGAYDPVRAGEAYRAWLASGPFDVGNTIRTGLTALAGKGRASEASQANGALMRVAPIGIHAAGQPLRAAALARRDAALTHPHPICVEASAAFAAAIAAGVAGADRAEMWAAAHAVCRDDAEGAVLRRSLRQALAAPPADMTSNAGWVLHAFTNAFHHLWIGQSVEEALVATVMAAGDTDTNAAICGALLGAAEGRSGIALRWRSSVLSCRAVLAPGVIHPRPTDYWPDDALDLAEALLPV